MKKKEKLLIAVLVLITVVVIVFAATRNKENTQGDVLSNAGVSDNVENLQEPVEEKYVTTSEDGTKVNTSEALKANKVVNGVEFSDIQLTQKSGETVLTATVKNTGSAATEMFAVDITLIDDAGQDIVTVGGLVAPMEAGATSTFETSMTLDYANSYDFRVTAK